MPNVALRKHRKVSTFRKIALGTWRTTYDPSVYGTLTVRMDAAMDYVTRYRAATGKRLTVTHLMAKALANAIEAMPDANALIRFGSLYLRDNVTFGFQVVMEEGEGDDKKLDLSALTLRDVEKKSLTEIVDEFNDEVEKVRGRKDVALEKTRGRFKKLHSLVVHYMLRMVGFLTYTLNLDLRKLDVPKDPFGSAMITNIGSLGLETAYVPLVPYSRVPLLIALGAVQDVPVVEDGQLTVGKVMRISATFDHRIMDGAHAAIMCREITRCFENPDEAFGQVT